MALTSAQAIQLLVDNPADYATPEALRNLAKGYIWDSHKL